MSSALYTETIVHVMSGATPEERLELEAEIGEITVELRRLRGVAPWNPQMAEKIRWQIAACDRHLERLEAKL